MSSFIGDKAIRAKCFLDVAVLDSTAMASEKLPCSFQLNGTQAILMSIRPVYVSSAGEDICNTFASWLFR